LTLLFLLFKVQKKLEDAVTDTTLIAQDLDKQIIATQRRFQKAMKARLPRMSLESKERYFAVLSLLVAKLEDPNKPLREVLQDVLFESDICEQSAQALAERLGFSRLDSNGCAQDFAHFLLGAPTMLSGTLLELRLNVVLEVADNQLGHDMPPYDITTSSPLAALGTSSLWLPGARVMPNPEGVRDDYG